MNVMLASASVDNIIVTIANPIDLNFLNKELGIEVTKKLLNKSKDGKIYAFAVSKAKKSIGIYNNLKVGDIVAFCVNKTNRFKYTGRVIDKIKNPRIGEKLWKYAGNDPWEFIYFLTDIKDIDIDRSLLVAKMGYKTGYNLQGPNLLKPDKSELFMRIYGSKIGYYNNREIEESEDNSDGEDDFSAKDVIAKSKRRVGHGSWSEMVKAQYENKCAACELDLILRSGHIIRWADEEEERLNPSNGICWCPNHDSAFEYGHISLDDNYKVIINPALDRKSELWNQLRKIEGKQIRLPSKQRPSKDLLKIHRQIHGFE